MVKTNIEQAWDSQTGRSSSFAADPTNKFGLRSYLVGELVQRHMLAGGTALDVGCATGLLCSLAWTHIGLGLKELSLQCSPGPT